MGYPLRWNRTDVIYEVTIETIQKRYLLRPSREVRDLILGVISRAQARYPAIALYAFMFTRNEGTLLLSTGDEAQLAQFMCYVDGGIARKVGRLLDWSGKFWAGRYRAVPILDEDAITERLRYVLSRGVDEGLIVSPKDWPGATCVPALLGAMTLEGTWVNRDREARLRASGLEPPPSVYVEPFRVTLTPIPAWADLARADLVAQYRAMIDSIEFDQLVITKGAVIDPVELQRQDPFYRPEPSRVRRLSRWCHATSATLFAGFVAAYRGFCATFRAAAAALARPSKTARELVADFPGGSNPRPNLRVPMACAASPAWWSDAPPMPPPPAEDTVVDEGITEHVVDGPTTRFIKVRDRREPSKGRPIPDSPGVAPPGQQASPQQRDARPTRVLHAPRSPP
jgi:hypothetical protein